ncbi:MAG: hypothetical protein QME46_08685 [Thermoanaerobacteraceae bacterium]|nr:hypothetical protein [Thermoanaerobacteraceae bacterium]
MKRFYLFSCTLFILVSVFLISTPAKAAAGPDIVISEIYRKYLYSTDNFIELVNVSDRDVDLSTYTLTTISIGTKTATERLNGVMPAHSVMVFDNMTSTTMGEVIKNLGNVGVVELANDGQAVETIAWGNEDELQGFEGIHFSSINYGFYRISEPYENSSFLRRTKNEPTKGIAEFNIEEKNGSALMYLTASNTSVNMSDILEVDVKMDEMNGLFGLQLGIRFDGDILQPVDKDGNSITSIGTQDLLQGYNCEIVENAVNDSNIKYAFTLLGEGNGLAINDDTPVLRLYFKALNPGETGIELDGDYCRAALSPAQADWAVKPDVESGLNITVLEDQTGTIEGTVKLQGRSDYSTVMVTLTSPDGEETLLHVNKDGFFKMENLRAGRYTLTATHNKYFDIIRTFDMSGGIIEVDLGEMKGGNLYKDDTVNIYDAVIVGASYGTNDEKADINGDGIVDEMDMDIIKDNFGYVSE